MPLTDQQTWNPNSYAKKAGFVSKLGLPVLELLAPISGERILDLGCGNGELMTQLKKMGCDVMGVDSSPEMIAKAQSQGLEAQVMSGEALTFETEFDAVFSNAALHWMLNPQAVIQGVWRSLKPGGRFVAEFGGAGNVAKIVAALEKQLEWRGYQAPKPWYFPSPEDYHHQLSIVGFEVREIQHFKRPTPLVGDVQGWIETFAQNFTLQLPPEDHEAYVEDVVSMLQPQLCDHQGQWKADYVRLRFSAIKPK